MAIELTPFDEISQFGQPWHGPTNSGFVHLPNGALLANVGIDEPEVYICQFPGLPVPTTDSADAALGMEWRNYAVFHGNDRRYSPESLEGIGSRTWLYRASDGSVYALHAQDQDGYLLVKGCRFGVIDEQVVVDPQIWPTIATFNWTLQPFTANQNWSGTLNPLVAAKPDGTAAIVNCYRSNGTQQPILVNVFDIAVSGGSDTTLPSVAISERSLPASFCAPRPKIWDYVILSKSAELGPNFPTALHWDQADDSPNEWVGSLASGAQYEWFVPVAVTYDQGWAPIEIGLYYVEKIEYQPSSFPAMPAGGVHPGVSFARDILRAAVLNIGASSHDLYRRNVHEEFTRSVDYSGTGSDGSGGYEIYVLGNTVSSTSTPTGDPASLLVEYYARMQGQTSGIAKMTSAGEVGGTDLAKSFAFSVANHFQQVTFSSAMQNTASYQPITNQFTTDGGFF